jgi:hypothetical protein
MGGRRQQALMMMERVDMTSPVSLLSKIYVSSSSFMLSSSPQ